VENSRRLRLTEAVTVRSLAAQTYQDWWWVVAVHPDDELLDGRIAVLEGAGVPLRVIPFAATASTRSGLASAAYGIDWGVPSGRVLTSRLDDDDAFTPDAMERIQSAARQSSESSAFVLPVGYRVSGRHCTRVRHESNAMQSLYSLTGGTVYGYPHRKVRDHVPVVLVDEEPGWLWLRHPDALEWCRWASHPITAQVRDLFPVDWSVIDEQPETPAYVGGELFI
jgi:hypothetical protein